MVDGPNRVGGAGPIGAGHGGHQPERPSDKLVANLSPQEASRFDAVAVRAERGEAVAKTQLAELTTLYEARETSRLADDVYAAANGVGKAPEGWLRASSAEAGRYLRENGITRGDLTGGTTSDFRAELYVPDPSKTIIPADAQPVLSYRGTVNLPPSAPANALDKVPGVSWARSNLAPGAGWRTNAEQGNGFATDQYTRAMGVAAKISDVRGDDFRITGHSLGGGLGQAGAAVSGAKATIFNPAGLHDATAARFAAERGRTLSDVSALTTAYQVRGEVLTEFQEKAVPAIKVAGSVPAAAATVASVPAHLALEGTALTGDIAARGLRVGGDVANGLGTVTGAVAETTGDLGAGAARLTGDAADLTGRATGGLIEGAGRVAGAVTDAAGDVADGAADLAGDVAGSLVKGAGWVVGGVAGWLGDSDGSVRAGFDRVGNGIDEGLDRAGDGLEAGTDAFADAQRFATRTVANGTRTVGSAIERGADAAADGLDAGSELAANGLRRGGQLIHGGADGTAAAIDDGIRSMQGARDAARFVAHGGLIEGLMRAGPTASGQSVKIDAFGYQEDAQGNALKDQAPVSRPGWGPGEAVVRHGMPVVEASLDARIDAVEARR